MADTITELEVLDQIVDVLGGTSGQYETVVPVLQQIKELLGGGGAVPDGAVTFPKLSQDVQDAIEEGGSGYNPSLSVGRADALTGADETAQWATRESTGSGAATVRSVQGAAVVWEQMCPAMSDSSWALITPQVVAKSVTDEVMTLTFTDASGTNAGVRSNKGPAIIGGHKYYLAYDARNNTTGAQTMVNINGSAALAVLGAVESTSGSEWARISGIVTVNADNQYSYVCLYMYAVTSGSIEFRNVICADLTAMFGAGNEPSTVAEFERMYPEAYYPYSAPTLKPVQIAGIATTDAQGGELDAIEWPTQTLRAAGSVADMLYSDHVDVKVGERAYQSGDESDATLRTDGTTTYYPLATPTTTPISPALPMTYRVQAGGSESIIVPTGEISAAPILTVAEGESAAELVMDALACIATPDGPTATANHAINTYLTMGGKLYKVTSAIAVGESIVAGTNVAQTTVMSELLALTA